MDTFELSQDQVKQLREMAILLSHYRQTGDLLEKSIAEKIRLITGCDAETVTLDLEKGVVTHGT